VFPAFFFATKMIRFSPALGWNTRTLDTQRRAH